MTYVIAKGCCSEASCVAVCPVDCIRPRPEDPEFLSAEQLYIDPDACTDCSACLTECPVSAIFDEYDMPQEFDVFKEINAEYFSERPLEVFYPARKPRRSLEEGTTMRVAVVGAGASGCYVTEELAKISGVHVTIFDKRPVPFGLIRSGVAPDHQNTKLVAATLERTLKRSNVDCRFNVAIGTDLSIEDLKAHFHAVILATGADSDRRLGIPGENASGSHTAREFVAWYNGDPDAAKLDFDLSSERVVLIGNGNVAMDVARILTVPPEELEGTDIADYALEKLRRSRVREVVVAARRGPANAAYTFSELWQLTRLAGTQLVADPAEVEWESDGIEEGLRFRTGRQFELNRQAASATVQEEKRTVRLRYFLTPTEFLTADRVEAVAFSSGVTGEREVIETGLVLRAIGYQPTPYGGLPFTGSSGSLSNSAGRIVDPENGERVTGLFCTGWARRGATGVIGSNKIDAEETATSVFEDFQAGKLAAPANDSGISELLEKRGVSWVDHQGWRRIDTHEMEAGRNSTVRRPRRKVTSHEELVRIAWDGWSR